MRGTRATGVLLGLLLAAGAAHPLRAEEGPAPQALTLDQAVGLALQHHPALAGAEAREVQAWAARDRAGAENWPQLRADGGFTHVSEVPQISPGPGLPSTKLAEEDTWVGTLGVQQLIWSGGRVSSQVLQAEKGAGAARAFKARARQLVVFGAERAFRLLLAAQEEREVAAKNLAAAENHLRTAGQRLEAGVAPRFDVLRAEVQAAEARQEVIRAAGLLQTAQGNFLQALGLREGDFAAVAPPPREGARPPLADLLRLAQEARPELEGLARQLEAAEAGVAAARAERWPTLGLSANYQWVEPESRTLFTRWTAGAYLSLPILDGGRAEARRREAEALQVQARAALETQQRQVDAEVRQAHARAESAESQEVVARKRLEQAEELLRLAEVRYSGGVGTATEVADAQASLAAARHGLTLAKAERGIADGELALATGATPTEEPGGAGR